MSLIDQVLGGLLGGAGSASPIQGVLANLLGGNGQNNMPQSGAAMQTSGLGGGLAGLLAQFQQAGLGNVAQSWINNGPNQSISPQQLQSVFGHQQVQTMASQANLAPDDFLSQLSQHLPNVVNGITPEGRLPDEGTVSV